MGKAEYLWRLSLGRSAFEPLDEHECSNSQHKAEKSLDTRAQLYDAKGRPYNPKKSTLDDAYRFAQNEVLAVTGVVQRTAEVTQLGARDSSDLAPRMFFWVGGLVAQLKSMLHEAFPI